MSGDGAEQPDSSDEEEIYFWEVFEPFEGVLKRRCDLEVDETFILGEGNEEDCWKDGKKDELNNSTSSKHFN